MTNDVLSRRLAVIVAADVVGYSRLMEADEAGTLAQLRLAFRQIVAYRLMLRDDEAFDVYKQGHRARTEPDRGASRAYHLLRAGRADRARPHSRP